MFPEDMPIDLGMMLMSDAGPLRIVAITDETVRCDFNNPMAGKTLHFEVEVVEVRAATPDELLHGHVHGPGGVDHGTAEPKPTAEPKTEDCGDGCGC